jgi:DsbC/DsbD-like thiol-disulfide interchange protein
MVTMRLMRLGLAVAVLLSPAASSAATRHVQASLVPETESIQPGRPVVVGIRLRMEDGWHTYWKNPADAGLPTRMTWKLPESEPAGGTPRDAYFFASEPQVLDYAAPQPIRRAGKSHVLELARDPNARPALARLKGVLVAEVAGKTVALEVDAPLTEEAAAAPPTRAPRSSPRAT